LNISRPGPETASRARRDRPAQRDADRSTDVAFRSTQEIVTANASYRFDRPSHFFRQAAAKRANSQLYFPSPANVEIHNNSMENTMAAHLPLRSTIDGFLAVAALAAAPLKPAPACGDGPAPEEPPTATFVWGLPRPSTADGATMRNGDGRLANLRAAATADGGARLPQIAAACEGGSMLRQTRRARRL